MAVDYQALRDLDLADLRARADAWTTVATRMSDSALLYASDVHQAMGSDDWTGAAAEHAGTRSGELSELVEAGATEAAAIRDILTSAVRRFGSAKSALDEVVVQVDRIAELRITDSGTVEINPDAGEVFEALWAVHLSMYQGRVDAAVDDARTVDEDIAEALSLAAETDNGADATFNGQALDLDGLEQAREDADRAVELFREQGHDDLRELNALLADNGGNPVFAERLMSAVGPEELFIRTELLMTATRDEDVELDAEVMANLGGTLATATNSDHQPHVDAEWIGEFMTKGAQHGHEWAGPLLANGEYHEDFIVPVAEHLIRMEQDWMGPGVPWDQTSSDDHPLTSALNAVHRNPDAALALMTGSRAYEDLPYVDTAGEELAPAEDNLTAMLDIAADDLYRDRLDADVAGKVVEAAATGMPAGTPQDLPRVEHTASMAAVTERLIEYVGSDSGRVESPGAPLNPIVDNLASVTNDYLEDFHRAFTDETARAGWQPQSHGHPLDLGPYSPDGQQNLKQFLQVIGHDQASSERLWDASFGTTAHSVQSAALEPVRHLEGSLEDATEPHSRMMAEIANGQLEAVRDDSLRQADEHNSRINFAEEAVSRTGSELLGTLPFAGRGLGEGWGHITGGIFSNFQEDGVAQAIEEQTSLADQLKPRYAENMRDMLAAAMREGGISEQLISGDPDIEDDGHLATVLEHSSQQYVEGLERVLCEDGRLPGSDGEC